MPVDSRLSARALAGAAVVVAGALLTPHVTVARQAAAQRQRPAATFRSSIDLVTINVVVRDKNGSIVRGLTRDDFTVTEDGRPQAISTFDFEEIARQPIDVAPATMPTVLGSIGRAAAEAAPAPPPPVEPIDMHGRRLIAMLFDISSMQPEEAFRAATAAREYVEKKLTPADMVAITVLSTTLRVVQDFTGDRELLLQTIDQMSGVEGQGFEEIAAADATDESATAFSADDSEFTLFNTDRRLQAIQALVEAMAPIEQKKSLIYFSSGMTQTGMDNRVAIRTVIDRAVRSNVSIYTADTRGLQALGPAGDASQASTRGQAAFSGRAVSGRFESMAASQDALTSLAEDTGGRAFFDQNEFGAVFDRIVADTSAYYLLGFTSTNRVQDGRFRRIRVGVRQPGYKLEYRAGYYAPRDFAHSGRDDREQQLMEQLFSDLSVTDLPVYASSAYFRLKGNRYFVPLWIAVPGSKVPFNTSKDKDKATLDILAIVRDAEGRPVARIRDTVNLALSVAEDVQRKNVQYQTDLELPPGLFNMKVVVRENQTGGMGSFEAVIAVPDLGRSPVRISSVVVGARVQASQKKDPRNPLLQNGQELIASIAHVIPAGQPLYLYYEMYDAAADTAGRMPAPPGSVPAPPGSVPAPPGSVPAPPGSVPAPPGSVPAPPGSVPAPPGSVPAPPGPVPAPPGPVPAPPGPVPAPPGPVAAQQISAQQPAPRGAARTAVSSKEPVRVLSNVVFFRGSKKAFETSLVEALAVSAPDRKATVFRLDVPTADLAPGLYTCQVNVIDDVAGTFAFPRLAVYIRK